MPFLVTKKSPATAGSSSNDTKRSSGGPSGGPGSGSGTDPHYPGGPDGGSANNLFKDDENPQSQNPDHDNNETGSETGSLNNTHQNNNGKIRQKDKIRRPMNAFMIFSKRHRPLVRLLNLKLVVAINELLCLKNTGARHPCFSYQMNNLQPWYN